MRDGVEIETGHTAVILDDESAVVGQFTEPVTHYALANALGVGGKRLWNIVNPELEQSPDIRSRQVGNSGREEWHYTTDFANSVAARFQSERIAKAGKVLVHQAASLLGLRQDTLMRRVRPYIEQDPSLVFEEPVGKDSKRYYIDEGLLEEIKVGEATRPKPPKVGEITKRSLAKELHSTGATVQAVAEPIVGLFPLWSVERVDKSGNIREYLKPPLAAVLRAHSADTGILRYPLDNEIAESKLLQMLGINRKVLAPLLRSFVVNDPTCISVRRMPKSGGTGIFVNLEFANSLKITLEETPEVQESDVAFGTLARKLGAAQPTIENLAAEFLEDVPDGINLRRMRRGGIREFLSSEYAELLELKYNEIPDAQEGEITFSALAKELNVSEITLRKMAADTLQNDPSVIKVRRGERGQKAEHLNAELANLLRVEAEPLSSRKNDRDAARRLRSDVGEFLGSIEDTGSLEGQEFKELVGLFGAERAIDILYKFRPEYHKLPVEYVKSSLAEYLGDFLTTKGEFSLGTLEKAAGFLSDTSFQDSLMEIVKSDCLRVLNAILLEGITDISFDTVKDYISDIRLRALEFTTPELEHVLDEVEAYYDLLFQNVHKPDHFVDQLDIDRLFPDINQRINVQEVAFKRRMLISDEMGTGKTASVIMAKEMLGVKQAVVIVPGNVIEVWQDHLVDYFKAGQAPRVLTVDSVDCLLEVDGKDYDYILISQERLNDEYTEQLLGLQFDMLIVDEIHKLKNIMTGKRSLNLLQLAERVESDDSYLALLSGTPVPNKISDVAVILKLLYPEEFKDVPNKQLVRMIIDGDALELRSLLLPRMQAKVLAETVKMPELHEHVHILTLSPEEQQVYELLMDEDEISANEKMQLLSQFVMNAKMLDATPDIPSTKIAAVGEKLQEVFSRKDKVVMFVNKYIEDVIRGEQAIFSELNLPPDVEVVTIEGNIPKTERLEIQRRLREEPGKLLLVVSGQTADVGVDFSAAQAVFMYNEPWTLYDEEQQKRRVYRPGLKEDMEYHVFITGGTIEDGIHQYIKAKHRSIEKILRGIPVSEIEKNILRAAEHNDSPSLEFNSELAEYYFSSWDKMMKIYAYVKEIGEPDFKKFLAKYGTVYAEAYGNLVGARSYQANASRLAGTLIDSSIESKKQDPRKVRILDVASGPEMLKRHIPERLSSQVTSIDINEAHFSGSTSGKVVSGSLLSLPIADESVDYANMSLSWHYTSFIPSKNNLERIEALQELNRVLRLGGRAVITMIHSLELRDFTQLEIVADMLGFKIIADSTGWATSGSNFHGQVISLEKVAVSPNDTKQVVSRLSKEQLNGIKFTKTGTNLRDVRKIATSYQIGDLALSARLNQEDQEALEEETIVTSLMNGVVGEYGSVASIPKSRLYETGLSRIWNGRKYILFKKLAIGSGAVVIR